MTMHSSVLAWRSPGSEDPGGHLQEHPPRSRQRCETAISSFSPHITPMRMAPRLSSFYRNNGSRDRLAHSWPVTAAKQS